MISRDLLGHVESCTYFLEIYDNTDLFSTGTGFCVDSNGTIITAAHVITNGRFPVKREEIQDSNINVIAITPDRKRIQYMIVLCGINVMGEPFKKGFTLDFAILKPKVKINEKKHLNIDCSQLQLGSSVYMSGYSEEVEFPFNIVDQLQFNDFKMLMSEEELRQKIKRLNRFVIHKSGMIGKLFGINFSLNNNTIMVKGSIIYIDNVMHSGSSGGPIVDNKGDVLGIIIERSTIELNYSPDNKQYIPSGTAVGLSMDIISPFYPYLVKTNTTPLVYDVVV